MRRSLLAGSFVPAFAFVLSVASSAVAAAQTGAGAATQTAGATTQAAAAQDTSPPKLSREELAAYAKVEHAVGLARDSAQQQLAKAANKTLAAQSELKDKLMTEIEHLIQHGGLTPAEYNRRAFLVATDTRLRTALDTLMIALKGAPLPGQVQVAAAGRGGAGGRGGGAAPAPVAVPMGPVGVHIGHIMNAFADTPMGMGLIHAAVAEATVAATHAGLAARAPDDLAGMQLHAGHVIHALDPTIVTAGPGRGYGVKKAAAGVASHIGLAAAAEGASANVKTHANHVATSANNTLKRVDEILALCKQIQEATAAPAAAALLNQVVALTAQLSAGADGNTDGRITWEAGEGGLQQAEEHITLLLRGEGLGG